MANVQKLSDEKLLEEYKTAALDIVRTAAVRGVKSFYIPPKTRRPLFVSSNGEVIRDKYCVFSETFLAHVIECFKVLARLDRKKVTGGQIGKYDYYSHRLVHHLEIILNKAGEGEALTVKFVGKGRR